MRPKIINAIFKIFCAVLLFAIIFDLAPLQIYGSASACAQSAPEPSAKSKITFKGGPGDKPETAVVILGARNSVAGISAEYKYLQQKFGPQNVDWMLARQSILQQDGKFFDRMDIELIDGSKKSVFFDISEFFGKL